MNILTEDVDFLPTSFALCNFYGEDTCFCWKNDKFVMFPYTIKKRTSLLPVLLAPGPIKTIQCFSNRVFFVCLPCGVYKLSREGKFSVLSKSAISIGSIFFEILTLKNDGLYLENKQDKSSKLLLRLPIALKQHEVLCTFSLQLENSKQEFRNALLDANGMVGNLCLIGSGKKLFALTKEVIRIIYSCDCQIINILPIKDDKKTNGLILATNTGAIIVIYAKDKNLRYKKFYLGIEIKALCAGFIRQCTDKVWVICSDKTNLNYITVALSVEICSKVKTEERSFICMQYYKQDIFVGLTEQKELYELSVVAVEDITNQQISKDDFINLHSGMLENSDIIIDKICERAKELQLWNEKLLGEEDKLYRINLYACQKKVQTCPKMMVHRIAKQLFLNVNIKENLRNNVYIACSLACNNETIFSIKQVTDTETLLDLHIPRKKLSNSLKLSIDLMTMMNKGQPWFLIRDFVRDPAVEGKKKQQFKKSKESFINAKINLIKNFMVSKHLDMKRLSEIKKSIRKEICDI